ncbi:MAG: NACHT domain-containing protein [Symploca sp. SIO2E6]|nr:NACHT domain-containing protein [Symploca sp. SIO2E6]
MPRAVILTALPVEYQAVRTHLTDLQEKTHPQGTIYEQGKFVANGQEWEVGIAEIGAGNVSAANETERAIAFFKPDFLFFVGIAGGVKDVNMGDVVVATKVYGYESGKVGNQFFTRPDLGMSNYALVQRARVEARKPEWLQRQNSGSNVPPRVFVAPIAAGEKVVTSKQSDFFQFLRTSYNDVVAVEMEGFGFLSTAFANSNIKAIVIRGISDLIEGKNDDAVEPEAIRQEKASHHASAFAFEILANLEADSQVFLVAQAAYLESFRQFFKNNRELIVGLNDEPALNTLAEQIKNFGKQLQLNEQEAEKTLTCFHDSILAQEFKTILIKHLQKLGLSQELAEISAERVSRNTHRQMKRACTGRELEATYGDRWQRDLEIYLSLDKYLEDIIAQKPMEKVFDEDFCFQDIYIPLEYESVNYSRICPECGSDNLYLSIELNFCLDCGANLTTKVTTNVIEEWAIDALLDQEKSGKVLFIQAGPGRGKSVFCRMFANRVRETLYPIYTPILIRLRDITSFKDNIEETISSAIGWDFATQDKDWLTDRNTRFLFLLDGFDELLLERGASTELQQFLEQVALFQKRCAENSERGHRVIITGRPMALYGIERLMPPNLERVEILPMSRQIQQQWLDKWQKVVVA